ncbi:hypothetical protein [Flavobacterium sp.]|uniref:hypothetical protein n=1 Tax=Flavobacterium sp. TaxID=239 RepID=UPI0031DCB519
MDTQLWNQIEKFDLDNPNDEYGFSTRLASENSWTIYFTKKAILEYKKFMYLAATSNEMVSPSEIVDIVWHQHLIFTNSYSDLCNILSKRIEHIPSTHNKAEKDKFHKAKEVTKNLYELNFGKQPEEIWIFRNPMASLQLNNANYNLGILKIIFLASFILLSFPISFLIKPVLIQIGNPNFVWYYIFLFAFVTFILMQFVKKACNSMIEKIKPKLIISNLTPFELIFFQKNDLDYVIHGVVNNLIENRRVQVTGNKLNLIDDKLTNNPYENCVIEIMKEYDLIPYPQLNQLIKNKPVFQQIKKGVEKIRETILDSKQFLFIIKAAMLVFGLLLSIGVSRIIIGISREKAVTKIVFLTIILAAISYYYFKKIVNYLFFNTIHSTFKKEKNNTDPEQDWQWNYFLYGGLTVSFMPLAMPENNKFTSSNSSSGSGSSCGSSCGNSCGSSCGSSCGGCGGD